MTLLEFFTPITLADWLLKLATAIFLSYVLVWVIALILSKIRWSVPRERIVSVYLAWLIALSSHVIFFLVILLEATIYFIDSGIPVWYCFGFLAPVIFSSALGISVSRRLLDVASSTL